MPRSTRALAEASDRDLAAQVGPAAGAGQAAVCALLPAGGRALHAQDRRPGGADPLAASRAGTDSADGLHSAGRGERADSAHRRLGAVRGMRPDSEVVPRGSRARRAAGLREPFRAPVLPRGAGRPRGGAAAAVGSLQPAAWPGDDRVQPDSRHGTALEVLGSLRRLGVSLLMDDFGTGYSSLHHLHSLPFDVLKIDRSFVSRMTEGDQPLQIVRTIVELARVLGMDVVAEGIETREQYALLRQLGCRFGQGFLFSRPVPAETISRDAAPAGTHSARARERQAQRELSRRHVGASEPKRGRKDAEIGNWRAIVLLNSGMSACSLALEYFSDRPHARAALCSIAMQQRAQTSAFPRFLQLCRTAGRACFASVEKLRRQCDPAWNDSDLGDDVATLSYERALRAHARYKPADRSEWAELPRRFAGRTIRSAPRSEA